MAFLNKEIDQAMVSVFLIVGCLLGLIILVGLIVGIILVMQSSQRDTVSKSREGWIHRRSEKDQDGW
jgi:hypothetical protein